MNLASLLLSSAIALQAALGPESITHAVPPDTLKEDREMTAFIKERLERHGLHNDVRVMVGPAPGCAYAQTTSDGRQWIVIDRSCVGYLRENGKHRSLALGILLHELAHILGGDSTNPGHHHQEELEADEWSGYTMYHLGSTLEDALVFTSILDEKDSSTHPARSKRIKAVQRGWYWAKSQSASGPPPPRQMTRGWWADLMATPLPWAK